MTDSAATNDVEQPLGAGPRWNLPHSLGRGLWIANIALLAGVVLWITFDPQFTVAAQLVPTALNEAPRADWRLPALWMVIIGAVTTLLLLLVTLFVGSAAHRRLRSWLAFTMLVAAWLTVLVGWREFAWQGQRLRLRATVDQFDAIAKSLREDWPTADGERAGLGSFMAYPQGRPRMLMMLMSQTEPQIAAIERADDGALGFEIRGEQAGTWLEWHPAGSTPKNFIGGLEGNYQFGRAAPLGRGWYLVRYR
ncbi:MAG: hypothetical protein AB7G28_00950 [Pirellulales bacterium]